MDRKEVFFALGYLLLKCGIGRRKQLQAKSARKMWVRELFKHRERSGIFHTLVQEMALGYRESYFK